MRLIEMFDEYDSDEELAIEFDELNSEEKEDIDFQDLMYYPSNVEIDPDTEVSLVLDGFTLYTASWKEVLLWIDEHWESLSGKFSVVRDGMVIHSFNIA